MVFDEGAARVAAAGLELVVGWLGSNLGASSPILLPCAPPGLVSLDGLFFSCSQDDSKATAFIIKYSIFYFEQRFA